HTQTAFNFSQKQRLKPGTVYYLDHPQAGMLIKVHALS
ncbi:peptidoglycan binding protein CsiV, partial [bacterium]|nr:peptidoglycan binding protein CsiV [bacterium]